MFRLDFFDKTDLVQEMRPSNAPAADTWEPTCRGNTRRASRAFVCNYCVSIDSRDRNNPWIGRVRVFTTCCLVQIWCFPAEYINNFGNSFRELECSSNLKLVALSLTCH